MKTQLTNLPAGNTTDVDCGNLVLQGFFSPTGTGSVVVRALVDGVVIREQTVSVPSTLQTVILEDFYQHQNYRFDCTGMSGSVLAIFTSQRL